MPTLSPSIAGWVGLLLFAAAVPAVWRGVFGALAAVGWGTLSDPSPRSLLGDGLFAVILGGVIFALYLAFFDVTPMLVLVLAVPALSVAGGAVCLVVAARRWGEGGGEATVNDPAAEIGGGPGAAGRDGGPDAGGDGDSGADGGRAAGAAGDSASDAAGTDGDVPPGQTR